MTNHVLQNFQKHPRISQLYYLLPLSREEMHGRLLRNNLDCTVPKCRTDRYRKSFIPAMCSVIPKQ